MAADGAIGESVAAELTRLREADRVYELWFERAPSGVCLVAPDGSFLRANPAYCAIVGRSEDELRHCTFQDITHPDDLSLDVGLVQDVLAGRIDRYDIDKRYVRPDASVVWVHLTVALVTDDDGQPLHFISMVEDITARRLAQERLRAALDFSRSTFDRTPVAMAEVGFDGVILRANAAAGQLLGCDPGYLVGLRTIDIAEPVDVEMALTNLARFAAGDLVTNVAEYRFRDVHGTARWASVHTAVLPDADGRPDRLIMQVIDITAQKQLTDDLTHAAHHDSLTGLANRARLVDELDRALTDLHAGEWLALLFVDLVGFKPINDRLGHEYGDAVLVAVADALRHSVRASDLVARLGGDEFVIIMPRVTVKEADQVVERVRAAVSGCGTAAAPVAATIGVAFGGPDATRSQLLQRADKDMYRQREDRSG